MYNLSESASSRIEELDPFSQAIKRLHISVIPDRLPCRDKDQSQITKFILHGLKKTGENSYGPLLISGMPGSGKTATAIASIREIQRAHMGKGDIPDFEYVEINCLRFRKAEDAYSILWRAITDERKSGPMALKLLNQYFIPDTFRASASSASAMVRIPIVCLLDEMEFLFTKNQAAMYNFLEWSRATHHIFILIGVTNAMDVVDRVMQGSIASRSAVKTTQMAFSSYTFNDITAILTDRIASLGIPGVDQRLIEICSRKAASFTGDIRTALKIFQRALELMREETSGGTVLVDFSRLIALVKRASDAHVNKPYIFMLQQSCLLDQAIMIAICKHIKATGGNNTFSLEALYERLEDLITWAHTVPTSHAANEKIRKARLVKLPRLEIFYSAILRLLEQGFLGDAISSNSGKTWTISDNVLAYDRATAMPQMVNTMRFDMMVGVRLEFGDIVGALREINALVQYVDA
jgi:Cdc6-like AAA superfamily ATPase